MISMVCEAAGKAAAEFAGTGVLTYYWAIRLLKLHSRCNGRPGIYGSNQFVCDCICHTPEGQAKAEMASH